MEKATLYKKPSVNRRDFLKSSGGLCFGIFAAGYLPGCTAVSSESAAEIAHKISAWVSIAPSGTITILNPAAEMGQGSMTALAAIVAEEMDARWEDIKIEFSPIEASIYGLSWGGQPGGPMLTVGSRTIAGYFESLRIAGAQVRDVLLSSAASQLDVPKEELSVNESRIYHEKSKKELSFGEIAEKAEIPDQMPQITADNLKNPAEFKLIGKFAHRRDIPEKVDGSGKFSMDFHLPDMVYGVISRSPVNGAIPDSWNEEEISGQSGVLGVVKMDHGVGIIAETIEDALRAKTRLQINWGQAKASDHSSDAAFTEYNKIASSNATDGDKLTEKGNAERAFRSSARTFEADYKNDYVYHCQMEPLNAIVSVAADGSGAEVWAGSQHPDGAKNEVAEVLGMEPSQINFHPCYLGGGFGRRSMSGYVTEAAILSNHIKRPVKLMWTREDDVQYGAFRPQSLQRMKAGVDGKGNITAWSHIIVGTGGGLLGSGARTEFYDIPDQLVEVRSVDHGVRTKHWRAVGHGPNKYAIEAFLDEIAHQTGEDPLQIRMQMMKNHPRAQKVLQTVAEMANWGRPAEEGKALGIAFAERSRSLGAGICELSVNRETGELKVHRFWAALDAGIVVHPDNVVAQMEGAIIMGISSVMKERISFKKGVVEQSNFHDYPVLRMNEIPDSIEIEIIDSTHPPTGVGESGIPLVGGAIANAFSALTGKYLRSMPFTPEKVLAVLNGEEIAGTG